MKEQALAGAFRIESFTDYLTLEAGSSRNTVEAYLRDIERLARWGVAHGAGGPDRVTPRMLRDFIYHLKDVGLASSSIRRLSRER